MNYKKLLTKVENYIEAFYSEQTDERLLFHSFSDTREVINKAGKILPFFHPDDRSTFIVCTALWFKNTGYHIGNYDSFHLKSIDLADSFLQTTGTSAEDIAEIKKCILAGAQLQKAESLPEKIVCDADTFFVGTKRFKEKQRLLKKEIEIIKNINIDPQVWLQDIVKWLEGHHFYTNYCKALLDEGKENHLRKIKNKQMEKILETSGDQISRYDTGDRLPGPEDTSESRLSQQVGKPVRGIETMFRISSSNSQKISGMADNKAHIMISVNSIIISVVLGLIVEKLDKNGYLIVPTIILLVVNVATIIYSVLATRPKVHPGLFTPEDVEKKSVNLLFYGSFYNMSFKDYDFGMREMMNDTEFLYGSLIKDIYWQGKVLGRKYKFLHMSYNIFMYGIAMSVIAFTAAVFFHR
ncbi:MAG: DUF5706 domain-containing protein [Bacteroidota bacterium]|nr:DUF5706 domain-containing protein [Bacteroidota bacterium]